MELTLKQIEEFYRLAYEDGRQAMNVANGMSQLRPNSDVATPTAHALYRVLAKDK